MKIHRLHINNLNSLKGEHEIRFDRPPLADTGLFAIVGETGAGKTTLLDAITLALYGQIDREKESSGGGTRIMTYGTATCHAELEFSTKNGRYLARWERSLARKKVGGKLQAAAHVVSEWDAEVGEWKFLTNKISETKALVPEITGLDYGRFTRSVMLPQGAFARFLQADENERADLLEQITGTGVYREISMAAFERHKLAVKAYEAIHDKLSNLRILTDEERATLQSKLEEETGQLKQQNKELQQVQARLNAYRQWSEAGAQLSQQQQKLADLEARLLEEVELRQRLRASDRLSEMAEQLREHQRGAEAMVSTRQQLDEARQQQAAHHEQGEVCRESVHDAAIRLNKFLAEKEEREQRINAAVGLEAREKTLAEATEKLDRQRQSLEASLEKVKRDLAETQVRLQTLVTENQSLRSEVRTLFPDQDTTVPLEELALLSLNHLATLKSEYQSNLEILARTRSAEKIGQLRQLAASSNEAEAVAAKALKHNEAATKKMTQDARDAREMLDQLLQSSQLTELKTHLEQGEPCPVCGSTDHPALAHWQPPSDELLDRQRTALAAAEKALLLQQAELDQARAALASARAKSSAAQSQLTELEAEWAETYPDQALAKVATADITQLNEDLATNRARQVQLTDLTDRLRNRAQTGGEGSLRKALDELTATATRLDTQLTALLPDYEAQLAALADTRRSLSDTLPGHTVESARLQLKKEEAALRSAEENARKLLEKHQLREEGNKAGVEVLLNKLKKLSATQALLEQELAPRLQSLGIPDLATAHGQLLTTAEAQQLRQRFASLDQAVHSLQAQIKEQTQRLRSLENDSPTEEAAAGLQQQLNQLEAARETSNQQIGALRQQLLTDDNQKASAGEMAEQLQLAEAERQRWAELDELIGSAKGDRFSRFAQSLTLDRLVAAANHQLGDLLEGRYLIDRKPSVYKGRNPLHLGLEIIDTFQADNRRDTQTLSGGESFLVSLALALGLSELAGGNAEIRSLFIDEGFGSLDEGLLDTVIDSLENLQAKGKTIGLISHVKELRERIYHKIVVEKRGDGFSTLEVR